MKNFVLNRYNNLTQRFVTAILGSSILIIGAYWNEWIFFALFFIICLISMLEFYKLVGLDGMIPLEFWGTLSGMSLFTISFLIELQILSDKFYFLIFPLVTGIFFIKLYKKSEKKPFTNIAFTFIGIIYVSLPFSLLNIITFSQGAYSYEIIIGLLLILWASDTGAYFAGLKFGKRKLLERVSPKKSWEGSIGGALLSMAMAYVISIYFKDLSLEQWLIVAGIIIIGGTYGDLVESLFKRSIEIKDSGTKLPGHGGFLDRFDSLLLASPFLVFYLKVF